MKLSLTLAVFLFSAVTARAQGQREPTDIELKAAYCSAVTKFQAAVLADVSHKLPESVAATPEFVAMEKQIAATRARLAAYMLPKLEYLDIVPVTLAMKRGEVDMKELSDFAGANNCRQTMGALYTCDSGAVVPKEVSARTKQCTSAEWLPF